MTRSKYILKKAKITNFLIIITTYLIILSNSLITSSSISARTQQDESKNLQFLESDSINSNLINSINNNHRSVEVNNNQSTNPSFISNSKQEIIDTIPNKDAINESIQTANNVNDINSSKNEIQVAQPQLPSNSKEVAVNSNMDTSSSTNTNADTTQGKNDTSIQAFLKTVASGFSVIILAEIGDKTFFLVMIFSATNSFWSTMLVASSVMLMWNLVCLMIGSYIPVLLFKGFLDFVGMLIFLFFGISMIYSAYHMEHELIHKGLSETKSELSRQSLSRMAKANKPNTAEGEKRRSLSDNNFNEPLLPKRNKPANYKYEDLENSNQDQNQNLSFIKTHKENEDAYFFEDEENYEDEEFGFHSKWAFASSLAIAEFGDKTQISSIIMGSTQNFGAVLIGTSLARVCGVVIAVLFGKLIAHNVTHKQVTYIGGFIFIFFAFVYMVKFFY